jgi:tRNA A22 N-methylase
MTSTDQVDNYGRPYTSVGYYNSKCQKVKDVGSDHWVLKCMVIKLGG